MEIRHKHIGWWLCSMLMLLCWSCGGQDTDTDTPDVEQGPFLEIKVYSPERSQVTRADIGDIPGDKDENAIKNLNIWVFEHHGTDQTDDGKFVGYLSVANPNPLVDSPYRILVSETFVDNPPAVDIYVTANVEKSNTGIKLDRTTTRAELEAALMKHDESQSFDPFGLTTPQSEIPTDGLPMSGVLKNQPVEGMAPIVSVRTNVKVARAVSKVRFVFCNSSDDPNQKLTIKRITFDDGMIPTAEYLFLNVPYTGRNYKVGSNYEEGSIALVNEDKDVASYSSPTEYAYRGQTGQEYESLINKGIYEEGRLTEVGKFYLRESDKKITGTITYTVGNSDKELSAPFKMSEEGDFSRNHTWIVYGFFAGKDNLKVFSVDVNGWKESSDDHEVYNW